MGCLYPGEALDAAPRKRGQCWGMGWWVAHLQAINRRTNCPQKMRGLWGPEKREQRLDPLWGALAAMWPRNL